MEKYKPVSCSFYDQLTDLAVLKKQITLNITSNEEPYYISGFIKDIITKDGEEFLVFESGESFRLDEIQLIIPE